MLGVLSSFEEVYFAVFHSVHDHDSGLDSDPIYEIGFLAWLDYSTVYSIIRLWSHVKNFYRWSCFVITVVHTYIFTRVGIGISEEEPERSKNFT